MRPTYVATATLLGFLVGVAAACDPKADGECPSGSEGGECAADYECLDGLTCLSNFCVDAGDDDDDSDDDDNADDGADDDDNAGDDGNDKQSHSARANR